MILVGFICFILFVSTFFIIEYVDKIILKNDSKRILRQINIDEKYDDKLNDKGSKTSLYWFDRKSNKLVNNNEELIFLNFPSFQKYINNHESRLKIFKNAGVNYLFAPIKRDCKTNFIVIAKKSNSIERIIKRKNNASP